MSVILISVLRSGDSSSFFNCFPDFDEYAYTTYVESGFHNPIAGGAGFLPGTIKEEILGGYISVLRGLTVDDIYTGTCTEPQLSGIAFGNDCRLVGKKTVLLYSGHTADRPSYHLIGEEIRLVSSLREAIIQYMNQGEDRPISGTIRDFNACLHYFGTAYF